MKPLLFLKNFSMMFLLFCFLIFSAGCIYFAIGSVGVVGGYIVSPDTVEGVIELDEMALWDATVEILSIMGVIIEENQAGGMAVAKISGAKVTVNISPVDESTVRMTVKARRYFFPQISIAQDVYVKIMAEFSK